jgi:hypothetical protein
MIRMQLNPVRLRPNWVNRVYGVTGVNGRRERCGGDFGLWVDMPIDGRIELGIALSTSVVLGPRGEA